MSQYLQPCFLLEYLSFFPQVFFCTRFLLFVELLLQKEKRERGGEGEKGRKKGDKKRVEQWVKRSPAAHASVPQHLVVGENQCMSANLPRWPICSWIILTMKFSGWTLRMLLLWSIQRTYWFFRRIPKYYTLSRPMYFNLFFGQDRRRCLLPVLPLTNKRQWHLGRLFPKHRTSWLSFSASFVYRQHATAKVSICNWHGNGQIPYVVCNTAETSYSRRFVPGTCTVSLCQLLTMMNATKNEAGKLAIWETALRQFPELVAAWKRAREWKMPDPNFISRSRLFESEKLDIGPHTGMVEGKSVKAVREDSASSSQASSSPMFPLLSFIEGVCKPMDYYLIFRYMLVPKAPERARMFWTMRAMVSIILEENFDLARNKWSIKGVKNVFLGIRDPSTLLFGCINKFTSAAFFLGSVSTGDYISDSELQSWVQRIAAQSLAFDLPSYTDGKHECLTIYLLFRVLSLSASQLFYQHTNIFNIFSFVSSSCMPSSFQTERARDSFWTGNYPHCPIHGVRNSRGEATYCGKCYGIIQFDHCIVNNGWKDKCWWPTVKRLGPVTLLVCRTN